ncbi:MAG: hypothetical protein ACI9BF_000723 [Candidatus Paceibacteria bacterium]|jgi:hypothetical protein
MEIKFQEDSNFNSSKKGIASKSNFLSKLFIKLGITKDYKVSENLSIITVIILVIISLFLINNISSEDEIDEKYYFDINETPDND